MAEPALPRREQWVPGRTITGVVDVRNGTDIRRDGKPIAPGVYCETSRGVVRIQEGDWIVTDARGLRMVERGAQ